MTADGVGEILQRLRETYANIESGEINPLELELSSLLMLQDELSDETEANDDDDAFEDEFLRRSDERSDAETQHVDPSKVGLSFAEGGSPKDWGEAAVLAAKLLARKAEALMPSPKGASELDAAEVEAAASEEDDDRLDPEVLARRLATYEAFRDVADRLREYESEQRQRFGPGGPPPEVRVIGKPPNLELNVLIQAFQTLWEQGKGRVERVQAEVYTMAHARKDIFERLDAAQDACLFYDLFADSQTRIRLVVMFLCLLELLRLGEVTYRQGEDGSLWIVREGNKGDDVVAGTS